MDRTLASGEIASLTSARGIAASWVAMFHFWSSVVLLFPRAHLLDPLMMCGYLAVPMFFVLSGYVIGLRYLRTMRIPTGANVGRFLLLRLARVYPVHLATIAVTIVLTCRHGWPSDAPHSVERLARNLTLTHAWDRHFWVSWNFPSWSISSEWFAYLIFPAVAAIVGRAKRMAAHYTAWICALLGALVYYFGESAPWFGLVAVTPCFIGGVVLAQSAPPQDRTSARLARATLFLGGATFALPFFLPVAERAPILVLIFFGLVALLGRQGHHTLPVLQRPSLVWLGEVSYSLYMTHAISITLVTRFVSVHAESSFALRLAWCVTAALGMVLATIAMYYIVERPARRTLRRALANVRVEPAPQDSSALS